MPEEQNQVFSKTIYFLNLKCSRVKNQGFGSANSGLLPLKLVLILVVTLCFPPIIYHNISIMCTYLTYWFIDVMSLSITTQWNYPFTIIYMSLKINIFQKRCRCLCLPLKCRKELIGTWLQVFLLSVLSCQCKRPPLLLLKFKYYLCIFVSLYLVALKETCNFWWKGTSS